MKLKVTALLLLVLGSVIAILPLRTTGHIRAALIPHHVVASRYLSRIFRELELQKEKINRIILVGPNHYEAGSAPILTTPRSWQTPFGIVASWNPLPLARGDDAIFEKEHSVSGIMPYIASYLPDAKVFTIILKHGVNDGEVTRLSEKLVPLLDEHTVLIASIDFSHYLREEIASKNDEVTMQLLMHLNDAPLYSLTNDYLDSPGSAALLVKICKGVGAKEFQIVDHANSAIVYNDPYLESTTSYITGYCETH